MSLLGAAAALAVGLVLLAAGVGHLRDARGTRAALAAHDVLPAGARRPLAMLLPPVELLLGAALVLTVGRWAAAAAVLLLAAFTAYLVVVLRRVRGRGQDEVPCGCGLGATPVSHWAVARAGLLTGMALLAAVAGPPGWGGLPTDQAPVAAQVFVALAAGLTLAVATAALPAARAVPATLTTLHPVGGRR